jgi:hypothetical protein
MLNPVETIHDRLSDYPLAKNFLLKQICNHKKNSNHLQKSDKLNAIANHFNRLWAEHPEKIKILYLVYYPLPNVIRQSLALRKTGRFITALVGICIREELRVENYFDLHVECNSLLDLANLLPLLKPDIIQVVTGPSMIPCLAVLFSDAPVVIEVYDSMIFYWENFTELAEYQMEKFSLKHARGALHKYPRAGHFQLIDHFNLKIPLLQFHAYVTDEFTVEKMPGDPRFDQPKLLITGGVIPPQRAKELGHTSYLLCGMIREVTRQGLLLTIYANQNAKDMRWHRQKEYFDIQKENPLFGFRCGVPVDRIPLAGKNYHFAFFYDNVELSRYAPIHFETAFATKLFSYIEMGIPILIYPELKYLYDIVEKYRIGIEYDTRNLSELKRLILSCDYQKLEKNVVRFREFANIKNFISTLEAFHSNILVKSEPAQCFNHFFPLENQADR